ncbi:hypothetical protein DdX_07039 [Ditylenchus destructor]|uniref:Uncharacterized protein n=1 Tax=Ditylenchus destructor TaxID=166010 RepID=A0AAD4R291_9BILA|nr:hypothetical protein DdX_07039 [Ditylenchus destructor]
MSPVSQRYIQKHKYLSEYYDHIMQSNNRIRHRIYHVKKEINHLKQLKKVLCERLLSHKVTVDNNLEIPDDTGTNVMDKVIGDVVSTAQYGSTVSRKRKLIDVKKKEEKSKNNQAKRSIMAIIDSVVAETHASTHGINSRKSDHFPDRFLESDTSADEQVINRLLRESSVDHLLPQNPDYEQKSPRHSKENSNLKSGNVLQELSDSLFHDSDKDTESSPVSTEMDSPAVTIKSESQNNDGNKQEGERTQEEVSLQFDMESSGSAENVFCSSRETENVSVNIMETN